MLETERLVVRKLVPEDLGWVSQMRSDSDVTKYLGNPPTSAQQLIRSSLDCYERLGFGQCAMVARDDRSTVGVSGLQPLEDSGEIEVGYSIKKEYWRRGIGYECALAWLDYGFRIAGLNRIVAVAHPDNTGSWRIMEKCGMAFERITEHYGMPVKFFSITRDRFLNESL